MYIVGGYTSRYGQIILFCYSENVDKTKRLAGVDGLVVADVVGLVLGVGAEGLGVFSGHHHELFGKHLLKLDALPAVIDVVAVTPDLRWFFWMELSAHYWVFL